MATMLWDKIEGSQTEPLEVNSKFYDVTKNLFARAVKPGYQGCISFARPFGCVASRVRI